MIGTLKTLRARNSIALKNPATTASEIGVITIYDNVDKANYPKVLAPISEDIYKRQTVNLSKVTGS